MARPTKYNPDYAKQAYKLCLLGATDEDLAKFFDVADSTLSKWKVDFEDFKQALIDGKETADAEVADSLNQRARGYRYVEQQAIKVKEVTYENGKRVREIEHVEVVPTERIAPPDTTACIFWLKNRRKQDWRDKQDLEHTGKNGEPIAQNVNITYMPEPLADDYFRNPANDNSQ